MEHCWTKLFMAFTRSAEQQVNTLPQDRKCWSVCLSHPRTSVGIAMSLIVTIMMIVSMGIKFAEGSNQKEISVNRNIVIFLSLTTTSCIIFLVALLVVECRERRRLLYVGSAAGFVEGILSNNLDAEILHLNRRPAGSDATMLTFNTKWEMPAGSLFIEKHLGSGRYGHVYKARGTRGGTAGIDEVAVKEVNTRTDVAELVALVAELQVLVHLGSHLNVVNLIGATTKEMTNGRFRLVVDYCRNGSLKEFLTKSRIVFLMMDELDADGNLKPSTIARKTDAANNRTSQDNRNALKRKRGAISKATMRGPTIATRDLIEWSFQIASGMNYLHSKKVIHGDVALRNILLADDNVVKISDLGFAAKSLRKIDLCNKSTASNAPSHLKWMAIESIKDRKLSRKSDVWSFGVAIWELFTLGQDPYAEVDPEKLLDLLEIGHRLEKPINAPKAVHDTMSACWQRSPNDRPTFKHCEQILANMMDTETLQGYAKAYDQFGYIDIKVSPFIVNREVPPVPIDKQPAVYDIQQNLYMEIIQSPPVAVQELDPALSNVITGSNMLPH